MDSARFSFPDYFSVRAAVAKKTGGKRCTPRSLPELGALPYFFTTEICEISLECLHNTVSITSSSQVRRVERN